MRTEIGCVGISRNRKGENEEKREIKGGIRQDVIWLG
jgi:hypothetical protein